MVTVKAQKGSADGTFDLTFAGTQTDTATGSFHAILCEYPYNDPGISMRCQ